MNRPGVTDTPPSDRGVHSDPVDEPRPLGLAFLLGVVVGSTATLLLMSDDKGVQGSVPRPVRLLRRRPPEPVSFGEVVRREAIHVAESVLRDVGHVASRWVLETLAAPPRERDDDIAPDTGSGAQGTG